MTLSQIRQRVREQTGEQYQTEQGDDQRLNDYINEGIVLLYGEYLPQDMKPLVADDEESELPEVHHGALGDYACWRTLSNGGAAAQRRAQYYYMRFQLAQVQVSRHFERRRGTPMLKNKYT